jgi:hypothetical protein
MNIRDWKADSFPKLAALCAAAPSVLEAMVSAEAAQLARELSEVAKYSLDSLSRDLRQWNLGFDRIREQCVNHLNAIWHGTRKSKAILGQDAAGGASKTTIKRARVSQALSQWWSGKSKDDAPVAVIGWQGAGKTWATLQWVVDHVNDQLLVLVVPSSAAANMRAVSKSDMKRFIGERLREVTEATNPNPNHWQLRFDRLLLRPRDEGPILTLVLDGMNQEPGANWLQMLKVLQEDDFSGRIRVMRFRATFTSSTA